MKKNYKAQVGCHNCGKVAMKPISYWKGDLLVVKDLCEDCFTKEGVEEEFRKAKEALEKAPKAKTMGDIEIKDDAQQIV